jgi:glycosyltransferase involved in cell wall biosynthesis
LFAGQFIPRKGVMILLQALAKLRLDRSDVAMLLLGRGILLNDIQEFLHSHNLEKAVRILGYIQQADLPKYCAISDVFVLPSLYDAFPVAIHEAMACGLPIITTEMVGATPDLVKDGVNGFVVPHSDIAALCHALDEILRDEDKRLQMAKASRTIIEGWSADKAVDGFRQAIEYSLAIKKRN